MSDRGKRKLINVLYLVTIVAAIASVFIGIQILVHISRNQTANHNDTQNALTAEIQNSNLNQQIIICMLQVPLAQRTTDLAKQCRTDSLAADSLTASTPAQAASTPVPSTTTTTTTTSDSAPSPSPTEPTTNTVATTPAPAKPLICTLTLGLLGCKQN